MRLFVICVAAFALMGAAPTAAPSGPAPIAAFTDGLTPARGLFTLWRKDGKVYVEISKSQLDADFIQTAEPASGLGGYGVTRGLPYIEFARIMRFTRVDNKIVLKWPNTSFVADGNPNAQRAVDQSFAPSIIATTPVVAEDEKTGDLIFDASPFLGDVIDMQEYLHSVIDTKKYPGAAYKLDPDRTYFGPSKAFADNVIIEADQTFAAAEPQGETGVAIDNVPDPRSVQIRIKYNITPAPAAGSYMPRIDDDRVGYYPAILLDYGNDKVTERQLRYILRWNIARHPMVYYISNTVPAEYRQTVRDALLTWNDAFAKIGIPNAVVVKDQPDDGSVDEDDIRYNTVHWLTQSNSGGYAQAGVVFDPRTGELVKTSIVLDADLVKTGFLSGADFADPERTQSGFASDEATFAAGARESMAFGVWALDAMGQEPWGQAPPGYVQGFLRSIVLHESGHNWGLQHNFIGTQAYSARDIRSKSFTSKYGISNSVMAYIPANVWPKGESNGDYFQTVLGPYDYYAIHWGYATIPGASTPRAELPQLSKWASSAWTDPRYRYTNDEDVDWLDGHAIDPRVNQWDLTNDNLAWCNGQVRIGQTLVNNLASRFNVAGATHDPMRIGFKFATSPITRCSLFASNYIGGEYLSRAHIGDVGAPMPLQAVSRKTAAQAFAFLDSGLFSANAWNFPPSLLRSLVYTEWVTDFTQQPWQYDPPARHDIPIANVVEKLQDQTLSRMFAPIMLQRIDDESLKYPSGTFMSLADLFAWTHHSVFGDLCNGDIAKAGEIHRSLQQSYARRLAQLVVAPTADTPYDAQSLARADLVQLQDEIACGQRGKNLDALTRAHLGSLSAIVRQTLDANRIITTTDANPHSGG